MRSILAAVAVFVGLAGSEAHAHAQNVSDPAFATIDCAGDSVATDIEGAPIVPLAQRDGRDGINAPPPPAPLENWDLCADSQDPRCAPLAPSQDGPSFSPLSDAPRAVGLTPVAVPLASFVVLPGSAPLDSSSADGPSGTRTSLDRPPRAA